MKNSSKQLNVILANALRCALVDNNGEQHRMMFLTSYGFITGVPKEASSQSDNTEEYLIEALKKSKELDFNVLRVMKTEHIKESDNAIELIGDGSFVVLSDVKIYNSSLGAPVLTINNFLLHAEDIIGITYVPEENGL
jgi:hypothetical protein